jgi:hypothetical protein
MCHTSHAACTYVSHAVERYAWLGAVCFRGLGSADALPQQPTAASDSANTTGQIDSLSTGPSLLQGTSTQPRQCAVPGVPSLPPSEELFSCTLGQRRDEKKAWTWGETQGKLGIAGHKKARIRAVCCAHVWTGNRRSPLKATLTLIAIKPMAIKPIG